MSARDRLRAVLARLKVLSEKTADARSPDEVLELEALTKGVQPLRDAVRSEEGSPSWRSRFTFETSTEVRGWGMPPPGPEIAAGYLSRGLWTHASALCLFEDAAAYEARTLLGAGRPGELRVGVRCVHDEVARLARDLLVKDMDAGWRPPGLKEWVLRSVTLAACCGGAECGGHAIALRFVRPELGEPKGILNAGG